MNYLYTTFDGLAGLAAEQLAERSGLRSGRPVPVRHGQLVPIEGAAVDNPDPLIELPIAEDVFVELGRLRLSGQLSDARQLEKAGWWGGPLRSALGRWSRTTGQPLAKRLTWRVVVQADDVSWRRYRRQELMLSAERALMTQGSWRINREEAPLEIWLWQAGHELIAGLRLTDNARRQRGGREVEREAALRPSIAAAMVYLSDPQPGDVVLDPMCGSGTLLLERAVSGRYAQLIGGDSDPQAVAAAHENFGPRHQPRRIERWDARQLPLESSTVTTVLCNLPWGRKIGEQTELPELYADVLAEMARVLQPGGRAALLTSERQILNEALAHTGGLKLARSIDRVEVLGRRADIVTLQRI